MPFSPAAIVLAAISVVGAIAIPFGDPQFLDRAIALELAFIALAVLVIAGNSLSPPHVDIMTTFSKPLNAVLLIIGGYVLQAALIGTATYELRSRRGIVKKTS